MEKTIHSEAQLSICLTNILEQSNQKGQPIDKKYGAVTREGYIFSQKAT
jgi:hypothetical protein